MKKMLFLSALATFPLAAAVPVKPAALLSPSLAELTAACNEGYDYGSGGEKYNLSRYLHRLAGSILDGYALQLSQGSVFSLCSTKARNLETKPDVKAADAPLLVMLSGVVSDMPEAERWAAALSFQDVAGKELLRFGATTSQEGNAGNWRVRCTSGTCTWSGSNYYLFEFGKMSAADRAKALKAAKVSVLVNAGNGIESFTLDTDQLNQL